jgi:hypothetical protein
MFRVEHAAGAFVGSTVVFPQPERKELLAHDRRGDERATGPRTAQDGSHASYST